jgi:hypothetical protein
MAIPSTTIKYAEEESPCNRAAVAEEAITKEGMGKLTAAWRRQNNMPERSGERKGSSSPFLGSGNHVEHSSGSRVWLTGWGKRRTPMLHLFLSPSPLLIAGEVLVGLSIPMFVGAIIAAFGDRIRLSAGR